MVLEFGCSIQANYKARQQFKDGSYGERKHLNASEWNYQLISEVYYVPELKNNLLSMG